MLPSSNNSKNYLHPSFSPTYFNQSTSSSSSSSLFGHGNDNNFFLQHHHKFPPGQFLLACVPKTTPTMAACTNIGSTNLMPERHVRKDRHSKIYTSHGLRDRRVRLSVGIARQFFDLQDLLGFDKASNTIEWLLIKSRKAIWKLAESRANSTGGVNPASSVNSEYETVSEGDKEVEEGSDQDGLVSKSKSVIERYGEEMNKLLTRESRAKARARAKERTRDKIYTRKLSELTDSPEPILNQTRSSAGGFTGAETFQGVAEFGNLISNSRETNQLPRVDSSLEESILIARKIKPTPSLNYQQTWMLSKDLNSYISCIPQSWDINGGTIRPSFAAHSSMNPSGEHQNYGKPWTAQNGGYLEQ